MTALTTDPAEGGRYYTHAVTGELLLRVTSVLGDTHSKPYLPPWSAKLAAEYAVDNLAMLGKLLAEQGRDEVVKLVKVQAELLRNLKRDAGTYLHDVAEALILWAASPGRTGMDIVLPVLPGHLVGADYDGEPLEQVVDAMVSGFLSFVSMFDPVFEASEMTVYNRRLGIAGTLDTIVVLAGIKLTPDGRLVGADTPLSLCVDFKSGKHLDATVQEQLAAYRRMTEALLKLGQVVPMPATDAAAVLHLRPEHPDGFRLMPLSPADDAAAWNRFRRAVEIAKGRELVGSKPGKVAHPPLPDGSCPPARLADLDGEGYGRTLRPLIKAGLADVAEVALMNEQELRGIDGIGPKSIDVIRRMVADHGFSLAGDMVQEVA